MPTRKREELNKAKCYNAELYSILKGFIETRIKLKDLFIKPNIHTFV